MDQTLHRCQDPKLVSASGEDWLPDDPRDYDWGGNHPEIGCNRLVCPRCGVAVRNLDGASLRRELGAAELSRLHAAEAPGADPDVGISPEDSGRLYFCRCHAWRTVVTTPTDSPDDRGPHLPWTCAGHPPLQLPALLDGIDVISAADDGDLVALARRALPSHWPAPLPASSHDLRGLWLARLYHLVDGAAWRDRLAAAVAACLLDPDPAVRGGAIFFFLWVPQAPAARGLITAARQRRDLFAGHPDPVKPRYTLEQRLVQAIKDIVRHLPPEQNSLSAEALAFLKEELLAGRNMADALYQVERRDHAWLLAHAAQVLAAAPELLPDLVYLVSEDPEAVLLPVLAAFARIPSLDKAALRASVTERVDAGVRAAALRTLDDAVGQEAV